MHFISGLSYGAYAPSLDMQRRMLYAPKRSNRRDDLLSIALEFIHPGNLGALPPNPGVIAYRAAQIGIAKYEEFGLHD